MCFINLRLVFLPLFMLFYQMASAQGCSDAGVCSATQHIQKEDTTISHHHFSITQSVALGDRNAWITGSIFNYRYQVSSRLSFGLSLPFSLTSGNLGTTYGIGDMIISSEIGFLQQSKNHLNLFIAAKIASNQANKQFDSHAMPMVYQQSSGTNDIIGALNWSHSEWFFAIGYQHAFNSNSNDFRASDFPKDSDAASYHSSAYLKRGDDIMLRVQKVFNIKGRSKIKAGILPIFRLQEDEIKIDHQYQKVENSSGLTLNLYAGWVHHLNNKISGELQIAAPPITREVRVDGTTRTFVINYILSF